MNEEGGMWNVESGRLNDCGFAAMYYFPMLTFSFIRHLFILLLFF